VWYFQAGVLSVFTAASMFGANYTYTKIVDNAPASAPGLAYRFFWPYLINGQGAVAFGAAYINAKGDTVQGIYTGSGNGIRSVYEDPNVRSILRPASTTPVPP